MNYEINIEESRRKLLCAIGNTSDVTFIRAYGNIGDQLIYAGARQLLCGLQYKEKSIRDLEGVFGDVALLSGSGGWCGPHHEMPAYLSMLEASFGRVIILPSSFDVSLDCVRDALSVSNAMVFAREVESFLRIQSLCRADLAHDTAFFFNYEPYQRSGIGILNAYRTDVESNRIGIPDDNNDISVTCETLDEWLWAISSHDLIRTDRAHVMIAGALLGKRVEYGASSYHKVPGIASFALRGYPVKRVEDNVAVQIWASPDKNEGNVSDHPSHTAWREQVRESRHRERASEEIAAVVPPEDKFIFIDEARLNIPNRFGYPFLERDGEYYGLPENDKVAVCELERLRDAGAKFVVFTWPAFWWFEHYSGFRAHLEANYRRVFTNERLQVFDLREPGVIMPALASCIPS